MVDKQILISKYWTEGKSLRKISEELGCSLSTVRWWFRKFNLPTRSPSEALKHKAKNSHYHRAYPRAYPSISITEEQEQLILGSLFGDAWCFCPYPQGQGNPCLVFGHTVKDWRYLMWKYRLLLPSGLVKATPYLTSSRTCEGIYFRTIHHPELWKFRNLFYRDGKKAITRETLDLLQLLGLAVWYMDDGSLCIREEIGLYQIYFHTQGFTFGENELIREWFFNRFELRFGRKVYVNSQGNPYLGLSGKEQVKKFLQLVSPYMPANCMERKKL